MASESCRKRQENSKSLQTAHVFLDVTSGSRETKRSRKSSKNSFLALTLETITCVKRKHENKRFTLLKETGTNVKTKTNYTEGLNV